MAQTKHDPRAREGFLRWHLTLLRTFIVRWIKCDRSMVSDKGKVKVWRKSADRTGATAEQEGWTQTLTAKGPTDDRMKTASVRK